MNRLNLVGRQFGRLTVLSFDGHDGEGRAAWLCMCSCSRDIRVAGAHLQSKHTKSCGCLRVTTGQQRATHGEASKPTPEYRTWLGLKNRCNNTRSKDWVDYGGRGIIVCRKWRDSYPAFLADMGRRPSDTHSIDRVDNDKGYTPRNCRWATPKEQANNKRRNNYGIG